MKNDIEPKVIAGIGEKKSNNGTQWYQQDRIYNDDVPILWQALVSLAMSLVIYEGVKLSTRRPRPFAANPLIKAEVPPLDKYSFPSGHTMNNLAVASTVFYCVPQYGWIMMLLPLTWGLLRVYFGVHWLTDVLCGFVLGILSFVLGHALWIPISAAIG